MDSKKINHRWEKPLHKLSLCGKNHYTKSGNIHLCGKYHYTNTLFQEFSVGNITTHLHYHPTTLYRPEMNDEKIMAAWSHNPSKGNVIGILITKPAQMKFIMEIKNELVVSAFVLDSSRRKWRIRANANQAGQLLKYCIGQKLKLTGIKGDLCKGAWDNAKRQIVPSIIETVE